ncbi:MAG: hypothetical protein H2174_08665 [Vampirovibrio sp.]|nr:hypothetical protein [Vampirovibrio sp.]
MNQNINPNRIATAYTQNLKAGKFNVRNLTTDTDSKGVSFENNLKNVGNIKVAWEDANKNGIVDNKEINITIADQKVPAKDITTGQISKAVLKEIGSIITGFLTKKPVGLDPTEPTLENTGEVKKTKSVEKTEDFNIPQVKVHKTKEVKETASSSTGNGIEALLLSQSDSVQPKGRNSCTLHAMANSIVNLYKKGKAPENLKTAIEKTVNYDPKTKTFTFTPSSPPTNPIVVTEKDINQMLKQYPHKGDRANTKFALALDVAWGKYKPEDLGSGAREGEVFSQLLGIDTTYYTKSEDSSETSLKEALAKIKDSASDGIIMVKSKFGNWGHAKNIGFDVTENKYYTVDSGERGDGKKALKTWYTEEEMQALVSTPSVFHITLIK